MMRAAALVVMAALAARAHPAHAQPNVAATAGGDEPPTAVAFVRSDDAMTRTELATVTRAFERALDDDARVRRLDVDATLAAREDHEPASRVAEAHGLIATGEALLRAHRANDALPRLVAASSLLEQLLPHAKKRDLARGQFLIGVGHALLGHVEQARRAFVRLLIWRRAFVVDTSLEPAIVLPVWQAAQASAAQLPMGSVTIHSRPSAALAYVDGVFAGVAPATMDHLVVGAHYITLRARGYRRQMLKVMVEPDRVTRIRAALTPSPHADAVAEALRQAHRRRGAPRATVPMRRLHRLLGANLGVFLRIAGAHTTASVYDLATGRRLAHAHAAHRGTLPTVALLRQLVSTLYGRLFHPAAPRTSHTPRPRARRSRRSWWLWAGVGVAITAITIPLGLIARDRSADTRGCPRDHVCGAVLFGF